MLKYSASSADVDKKDCCWRFLSVFDLLPAKISKGELAECVILLMTRQCPLTLLLTY